MTQTEVIEEFNEVLQEAINNYGHDGPYVRREIWELYLDTLYQRGEISLEDKQNWIYPSDLVKNPKQTN